MKNIANLKQNFQWKEKNVWTKPGVEPGPPRGDQVSKPLDHIGFVVNRWKKLIHIIVSLLYFFGNANKKKYKKREIIYSLRIQIKLLSSSSQ